jgi:hypothetical protein
MEAGHERLDDGYSPDLSGCMTQYLWASAT